MLHLQASRISIDSISSSVTSRRDEAEPVQGGALTQDQPGRDQRQHSLCPNLETQQTEQHSSRRGYNGPRIGNSNAVSPRCASVHPNILCCWRLEQ
jgi:hypothetical protein